MAYLDMINQYIMYVVQVLTGFYYYKKFLKKRTKGIVYFLAGILSIFIIEAVHAAEFILFILLLAASGFFICKVRNSSALLYAVITVLVMQFMFGIVNTSLCIVYPLSAGGHSEMTGVIFMLLGYLALPASVICYRIIDKHFSYDEPSMSYNRYTVMILMPVLMIFIIGEYINSAIYGNTIVTDSNGNIIGTDHYRVLAVHILGTASLFCVMFAYKKLSENFELHTNLTLLEQEESFLTGYAAEAKSRYEKTRSFRHDIKNHMVVLNELLREEKTEQALNYINDIEKITEEISFPYSTNHPIADILMENKLGAAKGMGIAVSCSLILPYPCGIRDIDFAVILSNALDNALYACEGMDGDSEKYIRVDGKKQGDFILLEIENSCRDKENFKKGTGLLNIQTTAEKYHGTLNIKTEKNSFALSVLLVIPQHSDSISQQTG